MKIKEKLRKNCLH